MLMFIQLFERCRKEVLFRHGIKHSDRGHPKSHDGCTKSHKYGEKSVKHRPYRPAECSLHIGNRQETVFRRAFREVLERIQSGYTEVEENINQSASDDRPANCLLRIFNREISLFHHLRNGLETEIRRNQKRHADNPTRNAERRTDGRF